MRFEALKQGRDPFKNTLENSLAQIAAVKSGAVMPGPVYVTTTRGMLEATPASVDEIAADIERMWSGKYPDLFNENEGLPRWFVHFAEKIGVLAVASEAMVDTKDGGHRDELAA